ncbi:hypothetical protein DAPPUDRAFT_245809 [Daphnia pulex]|uniref:Uncharacterized protein n=1 Tax=Daphnia pulex TaxID=6669 RepID=E9GP40_DAPPU|nr:hypothetical protein DAPPUDRAFT_245809 [Daphnia pulex]|eukprot:EFX78748.1 hypothetical protein DAPPUDRAFT_245809 [Daphnia pulex]
MAMEFKFMPNGLNLVHQPIEVQIPSTKFHCQCWFPTDARIALGLGMGIDPALEEEDLTMGDCETDEDEFCDWLNEEDCNFTTEAFKSTRSIIVIL